MDPLIMTPTLLSRPFIDFHTHILPMIDDGSSDCGTSAEMLSCLKRQGVGTVVLTPHFYTDRESLSSFLRRRETAWEALAPILEQTEMDAVLACEMHFSDYIFNCSDIGALCIRDRFLVTELPYSFAFTEIQISKIGRLISSYNITPVLAHIERYPELLKNCDCLDELIEMGCRTQINLGALCDGGIRLRKTVLALIQSNRVHVVGTDCHNMKSRSPCYVPGVQVIAKKLGEDFVRLLTGNAESMLQQDENSRFA